MNLWKFELNPNLVSRIHISKFQSAVVIERYSIFPFVSLLFQFTRILGRSCYSRFKQNQPYPFPLLYAGYLAPDHSGKPFWYSLNTSSMHVELPINVPEILSPRGGMPQTALPFFVYLFYWHLTAEYCGGSQIFTMKWITSGHYVFGIELLLC